MQRINFTESQIQAIEHLSNASYQRGIFMGVIYSIATVVGIAIAVKLTLIFGPTLIKYL